MKKLLILDDDSSCQEILKYFFERKGYAVETLTNGYDIYSRIGIFNPDLLIIDVVLKGEDGREICKRLRESAETRHLGILITSCSPAKLTDYKSCLADDFIEKPFELYDLEQKVESMLSWLPIRSEAFKQTRSIY